MSPQLSTRAFRSLAASASSRRITAARFRFRSSERSHFSFHVLQASLREEQSQQLVRGPQAAAGGDEGFAGEAPHGVEHLLELPPVVPVKATGPHPGPGGLAEEHPGEWLWAFGQTAVVIYKHRGIGEVIRAGELDAADLDLQLDQGNRVRGGAEVLPRIMPGKDNLAAVGYGGAAAPGRVHPGLLGPVCVRQNSQELLFCPTHSSS